MICPKCGFVFKDPARVKGGQHPKDPVVMKAAADKRWQAYRDAKQKAWRENNPMPEKPKRIRKPKPETPAKPLETWQW
ncbi:MAG: hypothetical protein WC347_06100 [Smithellaceae bacterium]